jgi:predicted nucleotidyltransferase
MLEPTRTPERASRQVRVDDELLHDIARVIAEASGAIQVILFGSAARGEADSGSDLDWLLVMPDEHFGSSFMEQIQPALRASQALLERNLYVCAMDFLPIRLSSFARGETLIALEAARDGRVLHG